MKTLSVYATGRRQDVARYRIWQYYDNIPNTKVYGHCKYWIFLLEKFGPIGRANMFVKVIAWITMSIKVTCLLALDILRRPDYIIVQREFVKRNTPWITNELVKWNVKLGSQMIWDFDDNILSNKEITRRSFDVLSKYSYKITVTHQMLKKMVDKKYHQKVILLPTTDGEMYETYQNEKAEIDKERFHSLDKELRIVWIATFANMPYLENVIPYLDEAAEILKQDGRKMILKVICNAECKAKTSSLIIENIKWSKSASLEGLLKSHVGIMPLIDSDFTRGKGGFKLVQYMSVGLPCIASNVGFNKEFIDSSFGFLVSTEGDWVNALISISDANQYLERSEFAFAHWNKEFSYKENLRKITELISD